MRRIFKWFSISVLAIYAVLAIGLFVLNRISSGGSARDGFLETKSDGKNSIRLLAQGKDSFAARLQLIERAKRTLELEFFIYDLDDASRILTQALIKKAKAGVHVRLLVDFSKPVFRLEPVYARYLKSQGVDVRYYNTAPVYRLVSSQHRSHRKLLIADGEVFITGGRNIAGEYFDMAPDYRFLDTDVEVQGPITESVVKSFDLYWNSDLSRPAEDGDKALAADEEAIVKPFTASHPEDETTVVEALQFAEISKSRTHQCPEMLFVTDFPNHGEGNRKVFPALMKELSLAEKQVLAESPYFVIKSGGYEGIADLTKRGVNVQVLTNSLSSTDAFYTVAALLLKMPWLARLGLEVFVYHHPAEAPGARYGLHSKRAVIDGKTTLIGTYNIDPRSANLNSEVMVVCRNQPEFAAEVIADWRSRQKNSQRAIGEGSFSVGPVLAGASGKQLALTFLTLPLANLFDFLL